MAEVKSTSKINSVLGNANPYIGVASSAYGIYENNPFRHMNNYIGDRNYNEPQVNGGSLHLNTGAYGDMFSDVNVLRDNIKGTFGRDIGQGTQLGTQIGSATGNPLLGAGLGAAAGTSIALGKRIDDIDFGDSRTANIGEGIAKVGATALTGPLGIIGRGIRKNRERKAEKAFNEAKTKQVNYLNDFTRAQEAAASQRAADERYMAVQQKYRSLDSLYI